MGRSVSNLIRAAAIACACALLLLAVRAYAQTTNDDRYGFEPIPAPTQPVQQGQLTPAQRANAAANQAPVTNGPPQQQVIAPPMAVVTQNPQNSYPAQNSYPPPTSYPTATPYSSAYQPAQNFAPPQGYAPAPNYAAAPQSSYPPPNYAAPQTSYPQAYAPPQGYPPPQGPPPGYAQGYTPAPVMQQQPWGYNPLPNNPVVNGGYAPASAPGNPYAYYTAAPPQLNGYMLGPGDKLHVSVYGEDDLSGEYQIDGSGMIRLPLIGTLRAAGYTAPAMEAAIAGALAQGYLRNPRVNVEISAYRPFYIIGAVNRPGEYPYVNNMSALDAVALGGGFTDQAVSSTIYVRHEGSTREEELPASQLTRVWPGDVVRVKTTLFWDAMAVFSPLAGPAAIAAAAVH